MNTKEKFQLLFKRLKTCPSTDTSISKKQLFETWKCVQQLDPENGNDITPAILSAVILFDPEQFGTLLPDKELSQLSSILRLALERYQLKTNPPNQPGKLLAASLKEST